jgi:hypothetical protein
VFVFGDCQTDSAAMLLIKTDGKKFLITCLYFYVLFFFLSTNQLRVCNRYKIGGTTKPETPVSPSPNLSPTIYNAYRNDDCV